MPGYLLHVGVSMRCPHGGTAIVPPSMPPAQPRVFVNGAAAVAVLGGPPIPIVGCASTLPCTGVQWAMPSTRVLVNGQPAMVQPTPGAAGAGVCLNPMSPAPPVGVQVQARVFGV